MKITSLSLFSNESEAIQLSLRNVSSKSPYMVRQIVGLDAEELIPKFYRTSRTGKTNFHDFSLKQRDIVMRIVLTPRFHLNEDYSYIRDALYRAISATRGGQVELQFHSGASTVAKIYGFIVKLEVAYFSQTPELQLTVRCEDPMFRSINPTIMKAANLSNVNPVVVGDSASTSPHGFKMEVTFTGTYTRFTVQDKPIDPEWMFLVVPQTSFLSGDVLHFSSEFKNKYLYQVRAGVTTHLLDAIERTSVWPIIFPGLNSFHFVEKAGFTWNFIQFDSTYWGV